MGIFSRTLYFSSLMSLSRTTSTLFTILLFLAVSILSLSPSASAEPCTPRFVIDEEDADEFTSDQPISKSVSEVIVREGLSFKMVCDLSDFNTIKWTIDGREITSQLQDELDVYISRMQSDRGYQHTELIVNNATHVHNGEYKCTSVCSSNVVGANVGVKVTVSIAINITLNGLAKDPGRTHYTKDAPKDKPAELICTAKAANAIMKWKRVNDKKEEVDMEDICNEKDDPKGTDSKSRPPPHCTLVSEQGTQDNVPVTVLKLSFYRLRKEPNETRNTLSDFRKYICTAKSEGNQDGSATIELLEMKERFRRSEGNGDFTSVLERERNYNNNETVSANRYFGKGRSSVTVVQGDKLEIYCDIHGVKKSDLVSGSVQVAWKKDGEDIDPGQQKTGITMILKDKPVRSGFTYDMAEPENRGTYTCKITGEEVKKEVEFAYYVRVKDKLGALWPFLAICGEVVVLCTIILIYEQQRNKAELEESDTDGSPDQKNSNDDGD